MISIHTDRLSDMMNITLSAVNLECKKKSFYTMRKKTLAHGVIFLIIFKLHYLNMSQIRVCVDLSMLFSPLLSKWGRQKANCLLKSLKDGLNSLF